MNDSLQTLASSKSAQAGTAAPQGYVVPAVDVFENDASITLLADLPGVPREQLHVRVDGDTLLLEANAATSGPEQMELLYAEAQCPAFRRQFTLSRELDAGRIDAQLRDGVLRLVIPKSEEARPRRIQVQVG